MFVFAVNYSADFSPTILTLRSPTVAWKHMLKYLSGEISHKGFSMVYEGYIGGEYYSIRFRIEPWEPKILRVVWCGPNMARAESFTHDLP